jgi:hypothetical protein
VCQHSHHKKSKKCANSVPIYTREEKLRSEFNEILGLLYVAMAAAHGGGAFIDDANAILLSVIRNGLVSEPVRASIFALVSSTSPNHVMSALTESGKAKH